MKQKSLIFLVFVFWLAASLPLHSQTEPTAKDNMEKVDKNARRKARSQSQARIEKERKKAIEKPVIINRPQEKPEGRDDDDVDLRKPAEEKVQKNTEDMKEKGAKSKPGDPKEGQLKTKDEGKTDKKDEGNHPDRPIKDQGKGPDYDKVKEAKEKGKNEN